MRILLYGLNFSPELTGIGKYSGEMASWLAGRGHSIRVITAPPYYPDWKVHPGYSAWRIQSSSDQPLRIIRCPLYVPQSPTMLSRLVHLATFAITSFFPLLMQWRWKPNLIVVVVPTLFCVPGALALSWICRSPIVLHVQDFEIDALFGLKIGRSTWVRRAAASCERWLLRRCDRVSTISGGMLNRARTKGVLPQRLLYFPNWSELSHFRNAEPSSSLMQQLGVPAGRKVLLYSGNIGEKQGLDLLLDAALALRDREELYFLLVGEGAGKTALVQRATRLELSNVGFAPLQPWELLPSLLASATVHLVIQKRGVADAVLPSKLTNILAVGGNSVITADANTTLGLLCIEHQGIGTLVEPENLDALVKGIELALQQPLPNSVAISYAKENLDKDRVLEKFEDDLRVLAQEQQP